MSDREVPRVTTALPAFVILLEIDSARPRVAICGTGQPDTQALLAWIEGQTDMLELLSRAIVLEGDPAMLDRLETAAAELEEDPTRLAELRDALGLPGDAAA